MTDRQTPLVYCAVDTVDLDQAQSLAAQLKGLGIGLKLGKEFFTAHGPQGVRAVLEAGGQPPFFLDLKFHDIPNTVAGAIRAAAPLQPDLINVHASGGPAMMKAAKQAALETGGDRPPLVLAVTILTSMDDEDLKAVGLAGPASDRAVALARLAQDCGIDGVVCSALEIAAMRQACGPDFKLLTPGIRPAGAATGDQKRVMTPRDAARAGSDYLVIGRPITGADDPAAAARAILGELQEG